MTNANDIKFRCSSLGYLMTEPKEKSPMETYLGAVQSLKAAEEKYVLTLNKQTKTAKELAASIEKKKSLLPLLEANKDGIHLSETTITHLVDVFISAKYERNEEVTNKFLEKGNKREEDSITLLSRIKKRNLKKNSVRLENELITGELDVFLGESIFNADETFDTKTSWSAHTFFRAKMKPLDAKWKWQGFGYMALSNAKKHGVALCLVNGLPQFIRDEKRRLSFQPGMVDEHGNESEEYIRKCATLEHNHIFDIEAFRKENPFFEFHNTRWVDIPIEERIHIFSVDREEDEIKRMYKRAVDCKMFMNEYLFKSKSISLTLS